MTEKIKKILLEIGKEARKASQQLAMADSKIKDNALALMGRSIIEDKKIIIQENQIDIEKAKENNISNAFLDRLTLNEERIESIAIGLKEISNLNDPVINVVSGGANTTLKITSDSYLETDTTHSFSKPFIKTRVIKYIANLIKIFHKKYTSILLLREIH